jgi:formamidopyrimidine-DNA glycosylase
VSLELPEVEVLRRDLERDAIGKKIKSVEAKSMAALGRYANRKAFTGLLEGAKVVSVARRGLHLVVGLDEDRLLVIGLGEGGGVRRFGGKDQGAAAPEITIHFTQHGGIQILDPTGTADVFVTPTDGLLDAVPALGHLGVDPLDEPMSWTRFADIVLRRKLKMKSLLTDPTIIVGIGDVYADEVLFNAGVRHDRISQTLSSQEVRRLYRALVETLHEAIKHRGTTLGPEGFTDLYGKPGEYQDHLAVYGREGQLSPRSRAPIQRVKFDGRWTYFCETQV